MAFVQFSRLAGKHRNPLGSLSASLRNKLFYMSRRYVAGCVIINGFGARDDFILK